VTPVAANQFDVNASTVALTASTAKTVVGVLAATNVALKLLEASASFDGATSSNAPALVDFARITFATNPPGTNSTSVTPAKREPGRAETIQATAGITWTAEPTVVTAQHSKDVGQFNGCYHLIHPFASPLVIVGAKGFGIRANSPNNVNFTGHLTCEE
jgi:hypothetical protein